MPMRQTNQQLSFLCARLIGKTRNHRASSRATAHNEMIEFSLHEIL